RAVQPVGGDRAVRHVGGAVDAEDLFFIQAFEQVAQAIDRDLVGHDQYALAAVFAHDGVDHAAQAQDDIAPAFATGRAEIELADVDALLVEFRVLLADAMNGQAVEDAEFLFPQAFVANPGLQVVFDAGSVDDAARRGPGPLI